MALVPSWASSAASAASPVARDSVASLALPTWVLVVVLEAVVVPSLAVHNHEEVVQVVGLRRELHGEFQNQA